MLWNITIFFVLVLAMCCYKYTEFLSLMTIHSISMFYVKPGVMFIEEFNIEYSNFFVNIYFYHEPSFRLVQKPLIINFNFVCKS